MATYDETAEDSLSAFETNTRGSVVWGAAGADSVSSAEGTDIVFPVGAADSLAASDGAAAALVAAALAADPLISNDTIQAGALWDVVPPPASPIWL